MGEGPVREHKRGVRGRIGRTIPRRHIQQAESPEEPSPRSAPPIEVAAEGDVDARARGDAHELMTRLARTAPRPVVHARIVLRMLPDPALRRPAVAKATLDMSGGQLRAHVAAKTMPDALDALAERLRRKLERVEERRRAQRHWGGIGKPGKWRHGNLPTQRPEYFDRPVQERDVLRRKAYTLATLTPEEAVLEMAGLDHDFHLFTNADSGEESVVFSRPTGGVGLQCSRPGAARRTAALPADPVPAPVMLLPEAIELIDATGERFVFFIDAKSRRGKVLYRRYDGHYGLIEPALEGGAR